jgi:4-hydroxybenzoate polyprenyltransferase
MSEVQHPFTLGALIKVTRFWNLVIVGLAQFFTSYFLIGYYTILDWRLYLLSVSTVMIAAGGYIINDYYDVKIDLINKPDRVVVGKSMRRRYALFFHSALSISGVALGLVLNWKIGLLNFFSAFLLWFYSNLLKRKPFVGNLAIAFLTGLSVYIVAALFDPLNKMIIAYSFFSFFITLIREIIKDMEDWKGDNTFGCQTLPILWGMRKTKSFIYLVIIVHLLAIAYFSNTYINLPAWMPAVFIFLPLTFLVWRLVLADTVRDFYNLSFYCKLILVLGIFSMVLV